MMRRPPNISDAQPSPALRRERRAAERRFLERNAGTGARWLHRFVSQFGGG